MEGKTIKKSTDIGQGYTLILFDDGEIGLFKVITPDGLTEDLKEFLNGADDEPEKTKTSEKKEKKEKKEEKKTVDEGEDAYTWKDLSEMDHDQLTELCEDNDLDTDPDDYDADDEDEMMEFRKDVAEEVGIEIPEKKEKKESKKEEKKEKVEDDDYTWDDLESMDYEELGELCEEQELDIDPDDYDEEEEDKLRKDIAKELEITVPKKKRK